MWNNPACSKCAAARETLSEAGVPVTFRAYLEKPPTAEELTDVLARLGGQPWDICREQLPELARDASTVDEWIAVMVARPELIQRPIILLDDGSAIVARTPEALAQVLSRIDGEPAPAHPSR